MNRSEALDKYNTNVNSTLDEVAIRLINEIYDDIDNNLLESVSNSILLIEKLKPVRWETLKDKYFKIEDVEEKAIHIKVMQKQKEDVKEIIRAIKKITSLPQKLVTQNHLLQKDITHVINAQKEYGFLSVKANIKILEKYNIKDDTSSDDKVSIIKKHKARKDLDSRLNHNKWSLRDLLDKNKA